MTEADVLVVGGGPAGSSCARGLREAGLRVVVLDRKRFPRDKTCAGWVTPQVFAELEIDASDYAKERVLQPILGFRISRSGDPEAEIRYDEPISYGIRRCEFDHYLLERCGAELALGAPLRTLERDGDGWLANGEIRARLVVGAGGHFCPVGRRLSHAGADGEPIVAAQELEFRLAPEDADACPVRAEVPELYFTRDLKGYGWLFRKDGWLNVGLGRQDRQHLSEHVREFLGFLRERGRLCAGLPEGLHGHAYLLHGQAPRRVVDDGLLLVGDAAGLAYPRSGEGIRPAIESGLLAARAIAQAGGDYRAERLSGYRRALEARFGPREPRVALGPTDLLPAALARWLAGRLLGNRWFARNVVIDRWFVHRHVAAL